MNPFAIHIARLADDDRFRSVVAEGGGGSCSLTLWVLNLDLDGNVETRLLYGWVTPAVEPTASRWFSLKPDFTPIIPRRADGRYRFGRLVITQPITKINQVLLGLGNGFDLENSCKSAGIEPPQDYGNLRLASDAPMVAKIYESGEPRFLFESLDERILKSPSASPVFSASIVRLHKTDLWTRSILQATTSKFVEPSLGADELARRSLEFLASETNLKFRGADSRRVGNIEWISPATSDQFENDCVVVKCKPDIGPNGEIKRSSVLISVKAGKLPTGEILQVRCRLFYDEEVGDDLIRSFTIGQPPLIFPCHDALSRIIVTVWRSDGRIVYEEDSYIMRRFVMNVGLVGLQGKLNTDWTEAIKSKQQRVNNRLEKIRTLSQVSYSTFGIGSSTPREQSESEIALLSKRLFPPKSGAQFFPQGWHPEEGPGVLAFVEWFLKLTEGHSISALVIVDPYFDAIGVSELVARAKAAQVEYVVLTCSQILSLDDGNAAEERRQRIKTTCEALRGILAHLKFSVLDLQSDGSSREPLFHDRYILAYGAQGRLEQGYHLSNSIQGATKKAPLLVTPIPEDILERVGEYVENLRLATPGVVTAAKTETIFSTAQWRTQARNSNDPLFPPIRRFFFAKLTNDESLHSLDDEMMKNALKRKNLMRDGAFIPPSQTDLAHYCEQLGSAEPAQFIELWCAFAEWRARLPGGVELIAEELGNHFDSIGSRLSEYLIEAPSLSSPAGTRDVPINTSITGTKRFFVSSFDDALLSLPYLKDIFIQFEGSGKFPVRYAVDYLSQFSPQHLVKVVEALVAKLRGLSPDDTNPQSVAIMHVLAQIPYALLEALRRNREEVLPSILQSNVELLPALAAQTSFEDATIEGFVKTAALFEPARQLLVLAERCGELRVSANRNNFTENEKTRNERLKIFDVMKSIWPQTISNRQLDVILSRMGGPGTTWASSTTADLLIPIIRMGKLTAEQVVRYWAQAMDQRLELMLKQVDRAIFFQRRNDAEISEALAMVLVRSSDATRSEILEALMLKARKAKQILLRPFSKSSEYSRWSCARDCVNWVLATMTLIELSARKDGLSISIESWGEERNKLRSMAFSLPEREEAESARFFEFVEGKANQ